MQTSDAGISFIKSNEGFAANVYSDNGVPAIGYGHRLLPGESYPNGITQEKATQILKQEDLPHFEEMVCSRVPIECTQGQFDALVDFAYNVRNQPVSLNELLGHGWSNVPTQLLRWCMEYVNGVWVVNAGLRSRRAREAAMFSGNSQ